MIGVPPFFYEFLEHVQNGGKPEDFRPAILGGPVSSSKKTIPRSKITGKRTSVRVPKMKSKRKVSKYQKVFGKHLKSLKRKHPRTSTSILMKKAHRLTKRELK